MFIKRKGPSFQERDKIVARNKEEENIAVRNE